MATRQLLTASLRSLSVNSTCTSFSASANVKGDTSGPAAVAVANAGGVPGGGGKGFFSGLQAVAAMPRRLIELLVRNSLRDFDMSPLLRILADAGWWAGNDGTWSPQCHKAPPL